MTEPNTTWFLNIKRKFEMLGNVQDLINLPAYERIRKMRNALLSRDMKEIKRVFGYYSKTTDFNYEILSQFAVEGWHPLIINHELHCWYDDSFTITSNDELWQLPPESEEPLHPNYGAFLREREEDNVVFNEILRISSDWVYSFTNTASFSDNVETVVSTGKIGFLRNAAVIVAPNLVKAYLEGALPEQKPTMTRSRLKYIFEEELSQKSQYISYEIFVGRGWLTPDQYAERCAQTFAYIHDNYLSYFMAWGGVDMIRDLLTREKMIGFITE